MSTIRLKRVPGEPWIAPSGDEAVGEIDLATTYALDPSKPEHLPAHRIYVVTVHTPKAMVLGISQSVLDGPPEVNRISTPILMLDHGPSVGAVSLPSSAIRSAVISDIEVDDA